MRVYLRRQAQWRHQLSRHWGSRVRDLGIFWCKLQASWWTSERMAAQKLVYFNALESAP